MLARRELPETPGGPCIFLIQTNDGHGRCGLHDLRPAQCHIYPVFVEGETVTLVNDPSGCIRAWSYGDIDIDEEKARHARFAAFEAVHLRIVREWNRRIQQDGSARSFEDFCAYLLNHCAGDVKNVENRSGEYGRIGETLHLEGGSCEKF